MGGGWGLPRLVGWGRFRGMEAEQGDELVPPTVGADTNVPGAASPGHQPAAASAASIASRHTGAPALGLFRTLSSTAGGAAAGAAASCSKGKRHQQRGEFKGAKITVGADFQCVIPVDHAEKNAAEEEPRGGTVCWCPAQVDRTSCDVGGFLAAAKLAQPSLHTDVLLGTLHSHGYSAANALRSLQRPDFLAGLPQPVLDTQSLDGWAADEKREFTAAVFAHGKDFAKLHRRLSSKTVPQLILYYYLRWKGTSDFFKWREQADGSQDDVCAVCEEGGGLLCCAGCPQSFHFACCTPRLSVLSLTGGNWYCSKCTAAHRRWSYEPPSNARGRHDFSQRAQFRLMHDVKMMPVQGYKSLSCNPRCKHCAVATSGGARERRSGRHAAVAGLNVFRGAGLHVCQSNLASQRASKATAEGDGTGASEADVDKKGAKRRRQESSPPPSRAKPRLQQPSPAASGCSAAGGGLGLAAAAASPVRSNA